MDRRITVAVLAPFLAVLLVAGGLTGCASAPAPESGPVVPPAPADPAPVRVQATGATVDLGGGARLVVPPGAITPGATVHPRYSGARPSGDWNGIDPIAAPVELVSDPPNAIHGTLRLEFPVPASTPGADQSGGVGIATFDQASGAWTPFPSTYDPARHLVVASIPHFSWWNPFSWDWTALGGRVNQNVGQLLGKRAGAATCTSGAPAWVSNLAGTTNEAGVAVRSCAQTKDGMLDVEMVNNRPYGQVLEYGAPVRWGWHDPGGSAMEKMRNGFADRMVTRGQLYLPPLSRASVGVPAWTGAAKRDFHIGPTKGTLALDFVDQVASPALDKVNPTACAGTLTGWVVSRSPGAIRDDLLSAGGCLQGLFEAGVASGALNKVSVAHLGAAFTALKGASVVGAYWTYAGVVWKFTDLFTDAVLVGGAGDLGAGFSVLRRSATTDPVIGPAPGGGSTSGGTTGGGPAGSGAGGTSPAPAPVPAPSVGGVAETVGGLARTHANPANAGGAEGPSIPGGSTVHVACRRQGFVVQDGDPWWYRVASPPWSNTYWVSADAFYNNGHTSGPLKGTPFVDPAVPVC